MQAGEATRGSRRGRAASYPIVRGPRGLRPFLTGALRCAAWPLAVALVAVLPGCRSTPVTGRSSFNLFSVEQDVELGRAQLRDEALGVQVDRPHLRPRRLEGPAGVPVDGRGERLVDRVAADDEDPVHRNAAISRSMRAANSSRVVAPAAPAR